jgi:hypothetical protein
MWSRIEADEPFRFQKKKQDDPDARPQRLRLVQSVYRRPAPRRTARVSSPFSAEEHMNKRDITEIAIKLIAFYSLLKPTIILVSMVANLLLGTAEHTRPLLPRLVDPLVQIILFTVIIRKADWILNRLYRTGQ